MKIVPVIGSYQLLTKCGEQLDNKTTIRAAKVFFYQRIKNILTQMHSARSTLHWEKLV